MRLQLLGPLEVVDGRGERLPISGARERVLLAVLALDRGQRVSTDRLVDSLWPDHPPANALNVLRNVVLRLRKALGTQSDLVVDGRPGGYALVCAPGVVDVDEAAALLRAAEEARADGDQQRREALLARASALYRGEPWAGFDDLAGVRPEQARLAEVGLIVQEDRADALLALGRASEACALLEPLCLANPVRERPWLQRMHALHVLGRDAEALEAGRLYRRTLLDELGLDPSPAWTELEQGILRQDAGLRPSRTLPSGSVTFLRADLAPDAATRSDARWGRTANELCAALAGAVATHSGAETQRSLEGLTAAFDDARSAVEAAVSMLNIVAQRGDEVGLRIGLHSGQASPVDGRYVASASVLVDAIADAAHRGQVLLSRCAVDQLPPTSLGPPRRLQLLGRYRLAGHADDVELFALDTGRGTPGSPRAAVALQHNLPTVAGDFVGREEELDEITALLATPGLVSVVGPGGVGKSRLSIELAARAVTHGSRPACFVALAPLTDPTLVLGAFAEAMGLSDESPTRLVASAADVVAARDLLLVVDNCEHVAGAVADLVTELRRRCPTATVLLTSREPMGLPGEAVWRLAPLEVPPQRLSATARSSLEHSAVRLFVARAHVADRSFALDDANADTVAAVVRALDGLPLAIELAAPLVASLGLTELSRGLDDRLDLLESARRTSDPRHQVLRAALEWSHALLGEEERSLYRRLAVFAGPVDLDTVSEVCGGDDLPSRVVRRCLARLVERSLVMRTERDGRALFGLLETMKLHARELLAASPEQAAVHRRHAAWITRLTSDIATDERLELNERTAVLVGLTTDIRAAVAFLLDQDPVAALRLLTGSRPMWDWMSRWHDVVPVLDRALERAGEEDLSARAAALQIQGFALLFEDLPRASAALAEAAALFGRLGDLGNQGVALQRLAGAAVGRGRLDEAERVAEEALEVKRRHGDPLLLAFGLQELVGIAAAHGDTAAAHRHLDRAIEGLGVNGPHVAQLRMIAVKSSMLTREGDPESGLALAREVLDLMPHVPSAAPFNTFVNRALAEAHLASGDLGRAARLLSDEVADVGYQRLRLSELLVLAGEVLVTAGRPRDAVVVLGAAGAIEERAGAATSRGAWSREARLLELRDVLGRREFHRCWRRGAAHSDDDTAVLVRGLLRAVVDDLTVGAVS